MAITSEQSKSISQQISQIQSGISALSAAKSAGMTITPTTTVQQAQAFTGGGSGGSNVGAVNAAGQLVDSSGRVIGMANPADRHSPGSRQAQPETPIPPQAPISQIDTAQPSPTTAQAAPFTQGAVPFDQALQNLRTGGLQGQALQQAEDSLKRSYGQAADMARQTRVQAPADAGAGQAGVGQFLGATQGQPEPPSIIGGIMGVDSNFDSILTSFDEYFSPAVQKTSLVEEYQKLSKSLGIEEINAELIDSKRIIEGTEDDVRSEITAAGGLATDSQVLALANARNKSLIKNYNYLLDTKNAAMTQLNTMMELTMADRQAAEAEFDRKLGFAFKVAEFKERATTNARNTYMSLGSQMGWDTLLSSVSPYEQSVIGRTLGLDQAGLQNLALRSREDRAMQMQEAQLNMDVKRGQLALQQSNLATDAAQRANIYSQIADRNRKTIDEDVAISPYQLERTTRVLQGISRIKEMLPNAIVGRSARIQEKLPGFLQSDRYVDFVAEVQQSKNVIFAQELTAMREASKTGGAVGQVSDAEGKRFENALAALEVGQSRESLQRNLQQAEDALVRWYSTLTQNNLMVAPDGSGNLIKISN